MELIEARYMNLERKYDRHMFAQAMLAGVDTPLDRIKRVPGKDAMEYNTVEEIVDAAMADGFHYFEPLKHSWMGRGDVGYHWAMCAALQEITELPAGQCVLLMQDDYVLRQPFWRFERIANIDNLKTFQISQWHPHDSDWYMGEKYPPMNRRHFSEDIYYGFNGAGDSALIHSAEGAKQMLQWIEEDPHQFAEIQIYKHSREELEGCYSLVFPPLWLGAIPDETLIGGSERELLR